jgi:hypothetical protein
VVNLRENSRTFSDHQWSEYPRGLFPVIQFLKGHSLIAEINVSLEHFGCFSVLHTLNQNSDPSTLFHCLPFGFNEAHGYLELIG